MTELQPLDGVRILDFTQQMAGPFCTMLLGDMGADVVKVEKPDGDDIRRAGPPFIGRESAAFLSINRNKRSIVLDLKSQGGIAVAKQLIHKSDVLVQNMRPLAMNKLGLGYDTLKISNPKLTYCTISGFGSTGPYASRPGFDLIAQGMSGLMSITGHPGGPPARNGVPITDLNAGIYAALGILCAYLNRLKTGRGQHIDSSLLEAGLAYTIWESAIFFSTGVAPGPVGSAHPLTAPYQAFNTKDGHVVIGAANQANWVRLCNAIGRRELLTDSRFNNNSLRMENRDSLVSTLQKTFADKPTLHWLKILERAGVPAGPINNLSDTYRDPQIQARDMVVELDHPTAGKIRNIGIPVKLSDTPGSIRLPAPILGQHTDEILLENGYSDKKIRLLREQKAIC